MEENSSYKMEQSGTLSEDKRPSFSIMYTLRPDLYLTNAFRITGLSVDASPRDISRQGERLKIMHKLDAGMVKIHGILPLEPVKDDHELRDAIQRLHDPDKRLVDELFWFWPHRFGHSSEDPALQAVSRRDRAGALKIWLDMEKANGNDYIAMHNLAVFFHAAALDMEHLDRPLSTTEQMDRDKLWKQAYARWRVIIERKDFWSKLGERVRVLDDPRVSDENIAHIKKSMPLTLLSFNASLAVMAAERGDTIDVARQKRLMDTSGFPDDMVKRALRYAVKSLRDRIKLLCLNAVSDMDSDSADHEKIAMRLLENSRTSLRALDSILPAGYASLDGAHDHIAERVLLLVIGMLEKSKKYQEAQELMKKALNLARGPALRSRIEKNIKIVSDNLQEQQLQSVCWFCRTNPSDEASKVEVKMQGMAKQESLVSWDVVDWKHVTINVPRCMLCRHRHNTAEDQSMISALAGFALGKLGQRKSNEIFPDFINQNVKTMGLESRLDFPAVRERLSKGWKLVDIPKKK